MGGAFRPSIAALKPMCGSRFNYGKCRLQRGLVMRRCQIWWPLFPGYYKALFTGLGDWMRVQHSKGSACVFFEWRAHDGDIQVDGGVY